MIPLLCKADAARLLGVSVPTIGRLIACGDIEAFRVGGQVRLSPDAIQHYLNNHLMKGVCHDNDVNVE